jgi:hypothetical protein
MKKIIGKSIAILAIAVITLSFSSTFGGEGFQISLNGKVLLEQYGKDMDAVKNLELTKALPNDKITIRYYHCGRIGKSRVVTVKDINDKTVKEWRYRDPNASVSDMSCSVQDFLSLKKKNNVLKLYYSSSELPNGRQLATVILGGSSIVQP